MGPKDVAAGVMLGLSIGGAIRPEEEGTHAHQDSQVPTPAEVRPPVMTAATTATVEARGGISQGVSVTATAEQGS